MHKKRCEYCYRIIAKNRQICPFCGKKLRESANEKKRRNEELVWRMKTGFYTLDALAVQYHLVRERVRQIFKRETGMAWQDYKNLLRPRIRKEYCLFCGKELEGGQTKYCSMKHHMKWWSSRRVQEVTLVCANCGKEFHPFRNWKSVTKRLRSKNHFCSVKCNMDYIHKNYHEKSFIERVVLPELKGGDYLMKTFGELSEVEKKDAYLFVVKFWGKMTARELAEKLNLKMTVVPAMVAKLRKAGVDLPRISRSFVLTPSFVDELKQAFGGR